MDTNTQCMRSWLMILGSRFACPLWLCAIMRIFRHNNICIYEHQNISNMSCPWPLFPKSHNKGLLIISNFSMRFLSSFSCNPFGNCSNFPSRNILGTLFAQCTCKVFISCTLFTKEFNYNMDTISDVSMCVFTSLWAERITKKNTSTPQVPPSSLPHLLLALLHCFASLPSAWLAHQS